MSVHLTVASNFVAGQGLESQSQSTEELFGVLLPEQMPEPPAQRVEQHYRRSWCSQPNSSISRSTPLSRQWEVLIRAACPSMRDQQGNPWDCLL